MKKFLLAAVWVMIVLTVRGQTDTIKKTDTTFISVEKVPEFPGGLKTWSRFLTKNLRWPADDGMDSQASVFLSFIVEKNGRLTNLKVLKKTYPKFDNEALRVLKLSPKWIPAKVNGKPVRSKYVVPIRFAIGEFE
jgi:protein TonB